jgi:hypothetical protein
MPLGLGWRWIFQQSGGGAAGHKRLMYWCSSWQPYVFATPARHIVTPIMVAWAKGASCSPLCNTLSAKGSYIQKLECVCIAVVCIAAGLVAQRGACESTAEQEDASSTACHLLKWCCGANKELAAEGHLSRVSQAFRPDKGVEKHQLGLVLRNTGCCGAQISLRWPGHCCEGERAQTLSHPTAAAPSKQLSRPTPRRLPRARPTCSCVLASVCLRVTQLGSMQGGARGA